MRRFAVRCALTLLLTSSAIVAAETESLSTRCEESEIVLDSQHSAAGLGRCGDSAPEDLLWHLDRIDQVSGALDGRVTRHSRGAGVVIYVFDTGVMASHDEFRTAAGSRVIGGYDEAGDVPFGASTCVSRNKATAPCFADYIELPAASHGTSVASIAAGKNIGVAPDAFIVSVRVMNERGLATTRSYLDGLKAIVQHAWSIPSPVSQTSVVNISGWVLDRLSKSDTDSVAYDTVEKKMREMVGGVDEYGNPDPAGRKFLFVVAANNTDGGCGAAGVIDRFPAIIGPRIDGIVTVGGMTEDNSSWAGSCRGGVEILAPAQGIFSASITGNDHYRGKKPNLRSGTSFAAPVISGLAAILIAEHPRSTPAELESWLVNTPSRVVNPERTMADGRVAVLTDNPATSAIARVVPPAGTTSVQPPVAGFVTPMTAGPAAHNR